MAAEGTATRDMGIGVTVILSLLTAVGAIFMYLNPDDPIAGWAFALAMAAAGLAVVAAQVYG